MVFLGTLVQRKHIYFAPSEIHQGWIRYQAYYQKSYNNKEAMSYTRIRAKHNNKMPLKKA